VIYNVIIIATGRPSARKMGEMRFHYYYYYYGYYDYLLSLRLPTIIGRINILLHIVLIDRDVTCKSRIYNIYSASAAAVLQRRYYYYIYYNTYRR